MGFDSHFQLLIPSVTPPVPVLSPPVAPVVAAVPVAAAIPVPPAVPARRIATSGEWDFTDFVFSFAGRKVPVLKVSRRNGLSLREASKLYWQSYQGEISAELQRWAVRGWQQTTLIGPEALEMRKFNGYKDKSLLFWIIVILAAIPSVGMSLIWDSSRRPLSNRHAFLPGCAPRTGLPCPE